jgi:hypothetical protein
MTLRTGLGVTAALAILTALGAPASTAGQAPPIAPHRHFLVTPQGMIPVGPTVCGNPDLQGAFNQFHAKIHVGPANTAFDHSHNPVDITSRPC